MKDLQTIGNRVEAMLENAVYLVKEGEAPALPLITAIHMIEAMLANAKKAIKDNAMNEVRGTEGIRAGDYLVKPKAGGGRWSYTHIPQWQSKTAEIKALEIQAQLASKLMMSGQPDIITSDGEILPAAVYSKYDDTFEFRKVKY